VDGDVRVTYVGGTMYTVSSLRGVITYNTKT
jgi:hypothetical protein